MASEASCPSVTHSVAALLMSRPLLGTRIRRWPTGRVAERDDDASAAGGLQVPGTGKSDEVSSAWPPVSARCYLRDRMNLFQKPPPETLASAVLRQVEIIAKHAAAAERAVSAREQRHEIHCIRAELAKLGAIVRRSSAG